MPPQRGWAGGVTRGVRRSPGGGASRGRAARRRTRRRNRRVSSSKAAKTETPQRPPDSRGHEKADPDQLLNRSRVARLWRWNLGAGDAGAPSASTIRAGSLRASAVPLRPRCRRRPCRYPAVRREEGDESTGSDLPGKRLVGKDEEAPRATAAGHGVSLGEAVTLPAKSARAQRCS